MLEDENERQRCMSTGWKLKNNEKPKYERGKQVSNYSDLVSTYNHGN